MTLEQLVKEADTIEGLDSGIIFLRLGEYVAVGVKGTLEESIVDCATIIENICVNNEIDYKETLLKMIELEPMLKEEE